MILFYIDRKAIFCLLILIYLNNYCQCISESDFFIYKDGIELSKEDDTHSEQIILSPEITFITTKYESVYINTNGFLSFLLPIAYFFPQITLTSYSGYAIIAPFWADIDTSIKNGSITYKYTKEEHLLKKAKELIQEGFPRSTSFEPTSILICTWTDVHSFLNKDDKKNTFQVAVVSDGTQTFSIFMYAKLEFVSAYSPAKLGREDRYAEAGFTDGTAQQTVVLPGSGGEAAINLAKESNIGKPGVWIYLIGDRRRYGRFRITPAGSEDDVEEVLSPVESHYSSNIYQHLPQNSYREHATSPSTTTIPPDAIECKSCSRNARCENQGNGYCCRCLFPYLGSGLRCERAENYPVVGKINGTINGQQIDVELQGYVYIEDGRIHNSLYNMPLIHSNFQQLLPLFNTINWLFGTIHRFSDPIDNGFALTGGVLNRSALIRTFEVDNTTEQSILSIEQYFRGIESGVLHVETYINGSLPHPEGNLSVTVGNNNIKYIKRSLGHYDAKSLTSYSLISKLDTNSTITYNMSYEIEDSLTFYECPHNPHRSPKEIVVSNQDSHIYHSIEDTTIRFFTVTKIGTQAPKFDPCDSSPCHGFAQCIPNFEQNTHECKCNSGFLGDGVRRCDDINECIQSPCHSNAICTNTYGNFTCECKRNYIGNGFFCKPINDEIETCTTKICPQFSTCIQDPHTRHARCLCKEGWQMTDDHENHVNGNYKSVCKPKQCNEYYNCDTNANCVINENTQKYECICKPGFYGDGYSCTAHFCSSDGDCGYNAHCLPDEQRPGFSKCVCDPGYLNDGTTFSTCVKDVVSCNIENKCHVNAQCIYNERIDRHVCLCRTGYKGDGITCRHEHSCLENATICSSSAACVYDPILQDNVCSCRDGFVGDGIHCSETLGGPKEQFLIVNQGQTILKVPLTASGSTNNGDNRILYVPRMRAVGISIDCQQQFIYFTETSGKTIQRMKYDGTDQKIILDGLGSPEGIAIDWVSRLVFWTDSSLKRLEVAKLDGSLRKILLDKNIQNPRGIAVNPELGYIFWTDWNRQNPRIERANMDGSERKILVSDKLGLPNGLYYDHHRRELCWGDAKMKTIECVRDDGSNRRVILTDQTTMIFGLTDGLQYAYWTDWSTNKIGRIDKTPNRTPESILLPPGGNGKLYGLIAVKDSCPTDGINNVCGENNDCTTGQLCLPNLSLRAKRVCQCADNAGLQCLLRERPPPPPPQLA
ncbi:unnamed protein product [Adineta steineri]|uniref:Nidogen n=1 Tax=Adineta steineri TaxID=433720 RepID=A0A818P1A4_9BILA|nr:unnamed protein product [Adineta steineri]